MKKSKILSILIHIIVLAVFNALYFGIGGTDHPISAWISYGFIHLAYVMMIVTPYITQKGKDRSSFSSSMYAITSAFLIIEIIFGGAIIVVGPEGHKFSLFSQLIITSIYFIILFGNMMSDEHTANAVDRHESELMYIKESCSALKSILSDISDKQLYRKVEHTYDLIQSSPSHSSASVRNIENQVLSEIDNLGFAVRNGDSASIAASAEKITRLANERNRLLRLSN